LHFLRGGGLGPSNWLNGLILDTMLLLYNYILSLQEWLFNSDFMDINVNW
jgi:hypothetical protein